MHASKDFHFDVIVIGSGAGGSNISLYREVLNIQIRVVASQLAKSRKSVLKIEKGKYYHESEFMANEFAGIRKTCIDFLFQKKEKRKKKPSVW